MNTTTDRFTMKRTPGRRWQILDGDTVITTVATRAEAETELAAEIEAARTAVRAEVEAEADARVAARKQRGADFLDAVHAAVRTTGDPALVEDAEAIARCTGSVSATVVHVDVDGSETSGTWDRTPVEFAPEAAPQPDLTSDLIAAMDRVARLNLAKAELTTLRAWKANPEGEQPGTPVLDWMTDPTSNVKRTTRTSEPGSRAVPRTTEDVEAIKAVIVAERANGATWHGVGKALTAAGISTARGGRWYAVTVRDTATRLGVIDTPTPEAGA